MNKIKKNLKVVILAGGYGTRLSEYTKKIPKPMVQINRKPLLVHIINHYKKFGFKEFIIAAGYKKEVIKNYFKNKNVKVINTGLKTMTGGRIKRLQSHLKDQTFLLTYGDGLSDVNINNLLNFHKKSKNLVTLTAVRPPARFGELTILNNRVSKFLEKPQVSQGWINGGFFIANKKIFKFIKGDKTILEKAPLEKLSKKKQLFAYKHFGFWRCMDTKRDKDYLETLPKYKKI